MRIVVAIALIVCATGSVAQESRSTSDVFEQALRALPQHVRGLCHGDLPDGENIRQYAIANATITGAEQPFAEAAAMLHGTVIAEELVASYREVTRESIRIDAGDVNGARVLPLDEFATGPATYDWQRLNEKYPDVKAILRVSAPATAAGYALVRVDIIGPAGPAWGNFISLERQADGSWKHTRAIADGHRSDIR